MIEPAPPGLPEAGQACQAACELDLDIIFPRTPGRWYPRANGIRFLAEEVLPLPGTRT
jgi:hypothetical protein